MNIVRGMTNGFRRWKNTDDDAAARGAFRFLVQHPAFHMSGVLSVGSGVTQVCRHGIMEEYVIVGKPLKVFSNEVDFEHWRDRLPPDRLSPDGSFVEVYYEEMFGEKWKPYVTVYYSSTKPSIWDGVLESFVYVDKLTVTAFSEDPKEALMKLAMDVEEKFGRFFIPADESMIIPSDSIDIMPDFMKEWNSSVEEACRFKLDEVVVNALWWLRFGLSRWPNALTLPQKEAFQSQRWMVDREEFLSIMEKKTQGE